MRRKKQAFTLLEIMLVVTIIAILLAAAIKFMAPNVDVAKSVRVTGDLQAIKTSLIAYEGLNGFCPTTEQGLQALVAQPSTEPKPLQWRQFMEAVPRDPWGSEYLYRYPGVKNPNKYDIYSAGPDRTPDTADDIQG